MPRRLKFIITFLLVSVIMVLISCNSNNESISDSTTTPKNYIKDEQGFYILEDDFFKDDSIVDDKKINKLKYVSSLDDSYKYNQMRLYALDKQIPLFNCKTNFSHTFDALAPQRMNNALAIVELEGKITFKLQCAFAIKNEVTIRPLSANIAYEIDENRRVISFTITSSGQYVIETRSNRVLHLFVNSYDEFNKYKDEENIIYFEKGIYNKDNCKYIDNNNLIHLTSNTTVFIDNGAIIQGGFIANNASNIKIVGGGIVDGSKFIRNANTNEKLIPFEFNYCSNLIFDGICTADPAGWCYNLYFCNNVTLNNIKIISSRSNGDGVSLQSCQNVICDNSFVRTWDDSLVVKNYPNWANKNIEGATKNITFKNCLIWTDLAQSMEIGYETVGQVMEDITFDNIIVLHNYHKAVISIHNANNANINDVKFTNITIEDATLSKNDENNFIIDIANIYSSIWSTNHKITKLGSINNVLIENVNVISTNNDLKINISGCFDNRDGYKDSHYVDNVKIIDLKIKDEVIKSDYKNIVTNEYTRNYEIKNVNSLISGATFNYLNSDEYGKNYKLYSI